MKNQKTNHARNLQWIKAESGNTYLCNLEALNGLMNPTEADLKVICLDESQNPQNN